MIYPKHDYLLNRDLTPAERLEPQRISLARMINKLEATIDQLNNASEDLTEEQLETIASNIAWLEGEVNHQINSYWGLK